ncbi:hypothetical protein ACKWTF_002283 [Chironomus riparius]
MSGFYGIHLNGGSQFIKHPSAVNKQKIKYAVDNAKKEDTLKREPIQITKEKLNDSLIDKNAKLENKSKTLLVCKQNLYVKPSKENLRRKKNQNKEKGVIKLSIKKMQNKIDELSEVIKKKVSSTTKEQYTDDSKTEQVKGANSYKLSKKKTIQGLFLIAGILLYSFILVIISEEHDSSTNAVKINMPNSTPRKSLIDYLFNIRAK